MTGESSVTRITANTPSGSMTVELSTDYGTIAFSYSPEGIEQGIKNLVAGILEQSANEDQSAPNKLQGLGLPEEMVRQNAEIYDKRARMVFPKDAIEEFTPGSQAYSRGTLEQFTENLKPAILLMLDHLAATALVLAKTDLKNEGAAEKVKETRTVLLSLIHDHFRRSIQDLWK